MKIKDIQKVIKQFTNTSKLAFKAGYDGVEIHMAHGYLCMNFVLLLQIKELINMDYIQKL